jgi:type I restriction enzyme, S subunit
MNQELPVGWTIASLENISQINPRHAKDLDDFLPVTFAPMPALSEVDYRFKFEEERQLGKVRKGYTHFAEGDVLFAKITPCMENGKAAVASGLRNGLGCGTTELHVLRPKEGIDPKYLYFFLRQESFRHEAAQNFTGTAGQLRVPISFIANSEIQLPPSVEQRRIVAKLEKLLDKVEASRTRLEKIPAILKRFRQSVLAAACSGRLTADWREKSKPSFGSPNRDNSSDLPEIPESWRWIKLPDTGEMNRGKSRNRPRNEPSLFGGQYPFIQTGDIAQSGGRITSHKQTYNEAGLAQSRLWPTNTICITIAANIAESAILTYPACFPDSVVGINANPNVCLPEYIEFFIRVAKADLSTFAPATAQKNINIAILNEVAVPLPFLSEQHEIVRRVEELFALADRIEARYQKAKVHVDKLTQSILAKAFRGELVHQDPNDEPASELLNRINTQKVGNKKVPKYGRGYKSKY